MGHAINFLRIEDCKGAKARIERAADDFYARNHDWGENPSSIMPFPIDYHDRIFDTEEEAVQFIERIDRSYAQIAVRYHDFSEVKRPARISKAEESLHRAEEEYRKAASRFYFENHKSAFIGCPNCSSKISRAYMKSNLCPVCRHDMRPKSALDAIAAKKEKVEGMREQLAKMEREWQKSRTGKGRICWLVKVECHY